MTNTVIDSNAASFGGGLFVVANSTVLNRLHLSRNWAAELGGGLASWGTTTAIECTFDRNEAQSGGAWAVAHAFEGTQMHPAFLHIEKCLLDTNFASYSGGGLWVGVAHRPTLETRNVYFEMRMIDSTVTGNTAAKGSGGGFKIDGGCLELVGGKVAGNTARRGGGLFVGGASCATQSQNSWLIGEGAKIEDNEAEEGGGLLVEAVDSDDVRVLGTAGGVPFALSDDGRTVLTRGAGSPDYRVRVCQVPGMHGSSVQCSELDSHGGDAIWNQAATHPMALANDSSIVIIGLPYQGRYLAVDRTGAIVAEKEGQFVKFQESEVPRIAVVNAIRDNHPGWGMSSSVSRDWIAASGYHSLVIFRLKQQIFENVTCAPGVTAMAPSHNGTLLYVASHRRSDGVSNLVQIDAVSRECSPIGPWSASLVDFDTVRALALSPDGLFLYAAVSQKPLEYLDEIVQVLTINIRSGLRNQIATGSEFRSVVALKPLPDGGLMILSQAAVAGTRMFTGPWEFQLFRIFPTSIVVTNAVIERNRATKSRGGGLYITHLGQAIAVSISGARIGDGNFAELGGGGIMISQCWAPISVTGGTRDDWQYCQRGRCGGY